MVYRAVCNDYSDPLSSSLRFKSFADLFLALGVAHAHIYIYVMRRGGTISVDLSLFALLYNTNVMNKIEFNDFLKRIKLILIHRPYTFFSIKSILNHPIFRTGERLVNSVRGRECFVGLSLLLVYGLDVQLFFSYSNVNR